MPGVSMQQDKITLARLQSYLPWQVSVRVPGRKKAAPMRTGNEH